MTDWQPWPPPPDGELIEVEVPERGDDRHFCCVQNGLSGKIMSAVLYRRGSIVSSSLRYRDIPPTARWRRV